MGSRSPLAADLDPGSVAARNLGHFKWGPRPEIDYLAIAMNETVPDSERLPDSEKKAQPRGRTSRANGYVVWADYAWNTTSSGESWAHVWPNRERLEPLANVTVGPPAASAWSWAKLVYWPPVLRI